MPCLLGLEVTENQMYTCIEVDLVFAGQSQFSVRIVENSISFTGHLPTTMHGRVNGLMGKIEIICF